MVRLQAIIPIKAIALDHVGNNSHKHGQRATDARAGL